MCPRNALGIWRGTRARQELRMEILARAAARCMHSALRGFTFSHLDSEILNTVTGEE